jgi:hypothetical protein
MKPHPVWLLPAILALAAGVWAGVIRIGWPWPALQPNLVALHGPMMICGFLGTLISLERAIGTGKGWAYTAPIATGLGGLALIAGAPWSLTAWLFIFGSAVMTLALVGVVRLQPALFTLVIALGGGVWLIGNALWRAGWPIPTATLWWIGFVVLTIAGERLEMSRLLRLSRQSQFFFVAAVIVLLSGQVWAIVNFARGVLLVGLGMILMALWLWRYDIAWRRLKAGGQARFIAICLLSGYVWLAIGGVLALFNGWYMAGPRYDALLHAVFLGFVFTMIFGHAPIIFPAILKLPIVYVPRFYAHLILLHITLVLRISGDLFVWWAGRQWGGLLNAVVLLLFLFNTVTSIKKP